MPRSADAVRVLLFNLATDADDPVLGFTTSWINSLARRVEHVSVITMRAGRLATAPNVTVRSVGKERGWSEPRRAAAFYRHVLDAVRHDRVDVCFAHMIPVFAVMFAPVARVRRIPTLLWYAHGATPRMLRVAERLATYCVTSTPEGFRMPSGKLDVLHQGIEVDRFVPPERPSPDWHRTVVSLGRISPVKRVVESIDALAEANRLGADLRLEVFGGPLVAAERSYELEVRRRIADHGLERVVTMHGPIGHADAPAAFRRGGLFLNLSRSGSLDKAILEAMASGCLPLSSNDAFRGIAEPAGWPDHVTDEAFAGERLAALARAQRPWQDERRRALRDYVKADHSLDRLTDRIVEQLERLVSGQAARTSS
jgi:glycosyltransferase involved in cell wall biosynthesis